MLCALTIADLTLVELHLRQISHVSLLSCSLVGGFGRFRRRVGLDLHLLGLGLVVAMILNPLEELLYEA